MDLDLLRAAIVATCPDPANSGLAVFGCDPGDGVASRSNSIILEDQTYNYWQTMRKGSTDTGTATLDYILEARCTATDRFSAQKHMDEVCGTVSTSKSILLRFHYDTADTSPLAVFFGLGTTAPSNARPWILQGPDSFSWEDAATRVARLHLSITCPF